MTNRPGSDVPVTRDHAARTADPAGIDPFTPLPRGSGRENGHHWKEDVDDDAMLALRLRVRRQHVTVTEGHTDADGRG